MATLKEIGKKIDATLPQIEALAAQCELKAANVAEGLLALRTFATGGTGVVDIKGNRLKPYSEAYKKRREKLGLQTDNKDLIVSGATSRSIIIGIKDGRTVLGISTEHYALIAQGQEEQNNTKIFQLNDSERGKVKDEVKNFLFAKLRDITKQWH